MDERSSLYRPHFCNIRSMLWMYCILSWSLVLSSSFLKQVPAGSPWWNVLSESTDDRGKCSEVSWRHESDSTGWCRNRRSTKVHEAGSGCGSWCQRQRRGHSWTTGRHCLGTPADHRPRRQTHYSPATNSPTSKCKFVKKTRRPSRAIRAIRRRWSSPFP